MRIFHQLARRALYFGLACATLAPPALAQNYGLFPQEFTATPPVVAPPSGGTVTKFDFTNANGIGGTVATPTTTPNLTLDPSGITSLPVLATVGTVTTGVWQGTLIGVAYGGTGKATYTKGDQFATPGGAVLNLVPVGTDGFVWTADSASTTGVKWAANPSGGVSTVSVVSANGISGSVANQTTTPAITLTLGAITPTSVAIGAGSAITSSGPGGSMNSLAYTTPGTGVATALAINIGSGGAPVLFNGAGGTPTSLTLTNATGLPIAGIASLGTGVAAALANATGGTGGLTVFSGAFGVPTSITLTNATGCAVSTCVGGLGTGVAAALAINVGSAGAFTTFNGAHGTPSSITLTNATGCAISTCVGGLGTGVATAAAVNLGSAGALGGLATTQTWAGVNTFGQVIGTVTTQSGTTYTVASTDCGEFIRFSNGSAITVTLPNSLVVGCSIAFEQAGAGQITLSAGSGATLRSAHSYTKSFAQYSVIGVTVDANGGSAAIYIMTGDGA